ncbi:MAG: tetratricopeptide repeat protein [Proteobacteria bacterium]|nr:tetratricopeptide repeat protein [Pseudomonadota bacterium]
MEAQKKLALILDRSANVEKDAEEAIHWYQAAADVGDASALVSIGRIHFKGDGVAQDSDKARTFWIRAATLGSLNGHKLLRRYKLDVPEELQEAYNRAGTERYVSLLRAPLEGEDELLAQLILDINTLSPIFMWEVSRRTFEIDKTEGVAWIFVSLTQHYYDIYRCVDRRGLCGYTPTLDIGRAGNAALYMQTNPEVVAPASKRALEIEEAMPSKSPAHWMCLKDSDALKVALSGNDPEGMLIPKGEWPAAREKARSKLNQFQSSIGRRR